MEKLKVEYRKTSDLIPYARNARTHSEEQVTRLASSIKEFGRTNPILVDGENGVIAGHGRLAAAKKLGIEAVPTIELSGLTQAQKRAYILADNRMALDAGWDDELLSIELSELKGMDFDLSLTGFSDEEMGDLLGDGSAATEDDDAEVPEPPVEPVTKPSDVWIMGNHRLVCGDSCLPETLEKLMLGERLIYILQILLITSLMKAGRRTHSRS